MNEKKISFIRCINNQSISSEQDYYLSKLHVPEGYELDVLNITDAHSICEGYNEGMQASDAKYKVYLQQNIFIIEKDFIYQILSIFEDESIGMIGLTGYTELGCDFTPADECKIENRYIGYADKVVAKKRGMFFGGDYREVCVLDGAILATQVDLSWRGDIFKDSELYGMSQSFEMRRAGYKAVVAKQDSPWIIQDGEESFSKEYYHWLNIFGKEYKNDLITEEDIIDNTELDVLYLMPQGGTRDIPNTLKKCNLQSVVDKRYYEPNSENYFKDYLYLKNYYGDRKIKAVFSAIFIPAAAKFCYDFNIPYIAWIYDSPQQALFYPESKYPTNHIYIFDKAFCERARQAGCANVMYMPCAAEIKYKEIVEICDQDKQKYACDISFVGQLYNGDVFLDMFEKLSDEEKKPLLDYYSCNKLNWSKIRPWPQMPKRLCDQLGKSVVSEMMTDALFYGTAVMSRKLAQIERIEVLNHLAKNYDVHLYTGSDVSKLSGVHIHGKVDYYTEAKKVFALSKINLNITLPSIETGVPWRVFDIMGMGGFVLSNYQKEIEELFEIDKEIVVFRNLEELDLKIKYYLSHEEERRAIANAGFEKVKNKFNIKNSVKKMCSDVGIKG